MQRDDVAEKIGIYIGRHLPPARNPAEDDRLLGNGRLDSLGVLDVVAFLEKEFSIRIDDDDLMPENFDSVRRLTEFVQDKLAATRPGPSEG